MKRESFLSEIKGMSQVDLRKKSREIAEELMRIRFRKSAGHLEQSHLLRELKRNLARVLTKLNEEDTERRPDAV